MGVLPLFAQPERPLETEIKDITVFLARAQVTRIAKTRLEAGRYNLVIPGLAAQLDPQSIQVAGRGKFLILGTSHRQNFLQDITMSKVLRSLRDSLDYFRRQLVVEEGQKEILNKEEAMLVANQRIGGNSNLTVAELKGMADFFRGRLGEIVVARMKQDAALRKVNEKMARIQSQINTQNELHSRNSSEIIVTVNADVATPVELEVSYVVSRAGWQPVYDLRAANTKSPVQLSYKANVFQSTGEVWKDVKLTLSTANPNLGGLKPELVSQILDFAVVNAYRYGYGDKKMKAAGPAMAEAAIEADEMELDTAATIADFVSTVESAVNTSFAISLPYSVASSNQPTLVDIGRHELPANYVYAVAPKLDPDAFLMARAAGWEELNLLPGTASVFFEGAYVGKTFIDPSMIRDTISLSLGRDKRIVVKREKVKDLTSRKFIGANIREARGYEISVRNTRNEPVTLVIEDQVPVSRNSLIEVLVSDLGGASWNRNSGKLTWTMTLKPSETRKVSFLYEVKYPKDKPIVGI